MNRTIPRYALIPTRDRPTQLETIVRSLAGVCDVVVVVDNGSTPAVDIDVLQGYLGSETTAWIIRNDEQPPNLYHLWNLGFDTIEYRLLDGTDLWDVAVFNDDTVIPDGWFDYVAHALRSTGVAVACTDPYGSLQTSLRKTQPDGNIQTRMCPWAFIVRGEIGLRADESMHWWWGDTDFDWQACQAGGILLLPGYTTQNTCANSTTYGALAEQAGRDGLTFTAKWGWRPW